MYSSQYLPCTAIEIVGLQGKAITGAKAMSWGEFRPFRDRVVILLERIARTKTGALLFRSLLRTGKTVRIHSGDDWDDNAAKMDPNIATNGPAAAIQPFRPAHHNVELALKGSERAWRGLDPTDNRAAQKANIKAQMQQLGQPTRKAETVGVLQSVLNRAHLGMALYPQITNNRFMQPNTQLPRRLGISANDFDDMVHGMKYMPDSVYYPLCFLLYDYMLPGTGTDAQIRVMTAQTFEHDFKSDVKSEKTITRSKDSTAQRLDAAVLAHELVHAWRMMAGRRVVAGGWEEEAMTSGIGPFLNWRMTENSFRNDLGLKKRKEYANNRHSSELMMTLHGQVTSKGYRGMMF